MYSSIKELLEQLKARVHANLDVVRNNEHLIKEILVLPDSARRSSMLQLKFQENSQILSENLDFLEIQLKLSNFLEKYKNTSVVANNEPDIEEPEVELTEADYFIATIEGSIEFDDKHPLFCNEVFYNKLLEYYTANEEYEKCQQIMTSKILRPCRSFN
jgi:hypothetical protein